MKTKNEQIKNEQVNNLEPKNEVTIKLEATWDIENVPVGGKGYINTTIKVTEFTRVVKEILGSL